MDKMLEHFLLSVNNCPRESPSWDLSVCCAKESRLGFSPQCFAHAIHAFMGSRFEDRWLDTLLERSHDFEMAVYDLASECTAHS